MNMMKISASFSHWMDAPAQISIAQKRAFSVVGHTSGNGSANCLYILYIELKFKL